MNVDSMLTLMTHNPSIETSSSALIAHDPVLLNTSVQHSISRDPSSSAFVLIPTLTIPVFESPESDTQNQTIPTSKALARQTKTPKPVFERTSPTSKTRNPVLTSPAEKHNPQI